MTFIRTKRETETQSNTRNESKCSAGDSIWHTLTHTDIYGVNKSEGKGRIKMMSEYHVEIVDSNYRSGKRWCSWWMYSIKYDFSSCDAVAITRFDINSCHKRGQIYTLQLPQCIIIMHWVEITMEIMMRRVKLGEWDLFRLKLN